MTSQINSLYINIDEAYPVAGVDNDTQGFRDNFDIIKSSLAVASTEITELQDTTAKTTGNNDFSGRYLTNTTLVTNSEKSYSPGVFSSGTPQIQFRNGSHQRVVIGADDLNIVVSWDTTSSTGLVFPGDSSIGRYGRLILEISSDDPENIFNVNWAVEGGGTLKFSNEYPSNFKVSYTPKLIEFSTYDDGATMFVRYLGEQLEEASSLVLENYDSLSEEVASSAISLEKKTTAFTPSVLATSTLIAGAEGQVKVLAMTSSTGEMTVTVAAAGWKASGSGAISFDTIGQACTLQVIGRKWYCIGNNGAVFS